MNDDEYRLDVIGTYNIDMVEEPFFCFCLDIKPAASLLNDGNCALPKRRNGSFVTRRFKEGNNKDTTPLRAAMFTSFL